MQKSRACTNREARDSYKGRIKYYLYLLYDQRRGSLTVNIVAQNRKFIHGLSVFLEKIYVVFKEILLYNDKSGG